MTLYGSIWLYIALYGSIWPYMALHGSIWLYMGLYGSRWLYLALYSFIWLYMALYGSIWPYMALYGSRWLLRHVATSLQSVDDEAKQEFSDTTGFKIVTDLLQIVTTASDERQTPCHYGGLLESNLYKEQS